MAKLDQPARPMMRRTRWPQPDKAPGAAKQNSSGLLQRIALATATRPQAEVTSIRGVVAANDVVVR
jgi:hypothetical protein